jgi:hypothetical protein
MAAIIPKLNDPQFSDYFINKSINNKKGLTIPERFIDII